MNKFIKYSLSAACAILACAHAYAAHPVATMAETARNMAQRALRPAQAAPCFSSPLQTAPQGGATEAAESFGTLYTPSGDTWMYTADYGYDSNYSIESATFTIYNQRFDVVNTFTAHFELGPGETNVRMVQLTPWLTRKFFNIDDNYEVMVYVYANTEDYYGHYYTQVYSLKDGALIDTIDGNNVEAVDMATDPWSENFTLVFMREELRGRGEYMLFDVYSKAKWGEDPKLEHTFELDFDLAQGTGNSLPFLMTTHDGRIYYAMPYYEKPYFEDFFTDDPTPDNKFIIDLYDQDFNLTHTTTIPIVQSTDEHVIYTFPGVGLLMGNDDISFDASGAPVYVIGEEKYQANLESYCTDFYTCDVDGVKLHTIVNDCTYHKHLTDVPGYESQFFFVVDNGESQEFCTVNYPSCQEVARFSPFLPDGNNVTTLFDRAATGNGYQYVSSLPTADVDSQGNALHRFAWLNPDGAFNHYDTINLGPDVAVAEPYVSGEALSPYIFNTDDNIEYMFLVRTYISDLSSRTKLYLRIYGSQSNEIFSVTDDADLNAEIITVFLLNPLTPDGKLVVGYVDDWYNYTLKYYDLPLQKFAGGDGTADNPYLISTAGDIMKMYTEPAANYRVINDITFPAEPWIGNACTFYGTLDGDGHMLSSMHLSGPMFRDMSNAVVKNLRIKDSRLESNDDAGFIAGMIMGQGAGSDAQVANVHIFDSQIEGGFANYGAICGSAAVYARIEACSGTNVAINAPEGVVGGIVGRMLTSSSVVASLYAGTVAGTVAGGIAGETVNADVVITNCHVDADIDATSVAGGVIGDSGRAHVSHCYVQGTAKAEGGKLTSAGGVVGYLEASFSAEKPVVVDNNIVAMTAVEALGSDAVAHRIIGRSSGDERYIDWDHVTGNEDPADYPYINGEPETAMASNYVLAGLEVIDGSIADDPDTLEGQTITRADITTDFLAAHSWLIGESVDAPWQIGDGELVLYYEGSLTGIAPVAADMQPSAIKLVGRMLQADGHVRVYAIDGREVTSGIGAIDLGSLPSGLYVARCGHDTLKFRLR